MKVCVCLVYIILIAALGERSKIFRSEAEKLVLAFAVCGDEKQHFTATLFLSGIYVTTSICILLELR